MEKIVLPSTQKGFVSGYFWSLLWFLALMWAASLFSGHIELIYIKLGISSFGEFGDLSYSTKRGYRMMHPPLLHAGMYVSYIIAGIIVLVNSYMFVYSTREANTIFKEGDHWGKVLGETYGFPFSRDTKQAVFDRIVDITVEQPSISRILNTGTLKVKMITFTNADSNEQEWTIPAIKSPHERKAELEAALLGHEGLKVKFL